jgi:hypothetical protein
MGSRRPETTAPDERITGNLGRRTFKAASAPWQEGSAGTGAVVTNSHGAIVAR